MPREIKREKWILYKHTCDYELIKAVAVDVKERCAADVSNDQRYRMQERLTESYLYKMRNPTKKPLDAINHRINTLEFFMFGYEEKETKRFMFSPLGNLFLANINDEEKLKRIFTTMLFAIQFKHWANTTPYSFRLYPFRLLLQLMSDDRLERKLYNTEYAYLIAFVHRIDNESYDDLVNKILAFRGLDDGTKVGLFKQDEHVFVNTIYEWQYMLKLFRMIGILSVYEGEILCKLYHKPNPNSKSSPTCRSVKSGYASIAPELQQFVERMLIEYPCTQTPLDLSSKDRMVMDIVKEIYSFYPRLLLQEIGDVADDLQVRLLELPRLIETYANNPENDTAYLFEEVLEEGFNMFFNVEARRIGGAGHTDIECLYITKRKKFAVEAKSTAKKLTGILTGRLREHRDEIGGEYTVVITPRYVPAVGRDIRNEPIVLILASTFSEYLYNHIHHDIREIDYGDFDDIIRLNLGKDVSGLISDMTMNKFAARA